MFRRNKGIGINSWYYLIIGLIGLVLISSCASPTLNPTGSSPVTASHAYQEIKAIVEKLSEGGGPADYEVLIEKSRAFIKAYPKYKQVDEVYYILGTILVQLQRAEEGIAILEELIRDYPSAHYVEQSLLTLGLAYDKISEYDKADAIYEKLTNHSKYQTGKYAATAQQLLEQDRTERKGELASSSEASQRQSLKQFINKPAPDFQVADLKGETLSLAQYRGQVVLLNFWATSAPPCIAEMPHVKRTYEKYKDQKFEIVGISLDRSTDPLEAYVNREGIAWRQYWDTGGKITLLYNVREIPSTFLIDGAGIVRQVNLRGYALETAVADLVRENLTN